MSSTSTPNRAVWRRVACAMGRMLSQQRGKWKAHKVAFHQELAHQERHEVPSR